MSKRKRVSEIQSLTIINNHSSDKEFSKWALRAPYNKYCLRSNPGSTYVSDPSYKHKAWSLCKQCDKWFVPENHGNKICQRCDKYNNTKWCSCSYGWSIYDNHCCGCGAYSATDTNVLRQCTCDDVEVEEKKSNNNTNTTEDSISDDEVSSNRRCCDNCRDPITFEFGIPHKNKLYCSLGCASEGDVSEPELKSDELCANCGINSPLKPWITCGPCRNNLDEYRWYNTCGYADDLCITKDCGHDQAKVNNSDDESDCSVDGCIATHKPDLSRTESHDSDNCSECDDEEFIVSDDHEDSESPATIAKGWKEWRARNGIAIINLINDESD